MEPLKVIKIGGNIIEDTSALDHVLKLFSNIPGKKILVHGGGKRATHVGARLGVPSEMVAGRRITNAETLEIITMVYAGLINKTIVAKLQAHKLDAIGLTGADANTIQAEKRPVKEIDYGFVGDVKQVNAATIQKLIHAGLTPVFCPITHNQTGLLLNTNADTIAAQIAIGMSRLYDTSLLYCFELDGVLRDIEDKNSVIKHLDTQAYADLLAEGCITQGMLPKLENCFQALHAGVRTIQMGRPAMLEKNHNDFTTITL